MEPLGLRQLAGLPLLPLSLQLLPCSVHSFGNWARQRLGQPGAGLGRGRGSSVGVVWLKLSPQQAGHEGMDVTVPGVPAERLCINQLPGTGLVLMQHVALALHSPTPAPRAARHAPAAPLRLSGEKMLPAQHPAPHAGCSRDPPSVPQPTLPSGLLSVWVQPQEAWLQASQHCRTQHAGVGLMFQQRQELIIFQA